MPSFNVPYYYRQRDKYLVRGTSIIGVLAIILLSVGLGLPTWYVGYSPDTSTIVSTANYFYSCHASTLRPSTELICVYYNAYICNGSIPVGCQNATRFGCINPEPSAQSYQYVDAPITYISSHDLQRLRVSGGTAIAGIIVFALSIILTLISSFKDTFSLLLYLALVLLYLSDVLLVVALVTGSLVIRYYHIGCSLFVTGTMITFLYTVVGAFAVGRLRVTGKKHMLNSKQKGMKWEKLSTVD